MSKRNRPPISLLTVPRQQATDASQERNPAEPSSSTPQFTDEEPEPSWNFKKEHICKVYAIHGVLTLSAVVQLVALLLNHTKIDEMLDGMISALIYLFLAVILLLALAFVNVFRTSPANYLLAIVAVEAILIFVSCRQWGNLPFKLMLGVLAIVLVTNLLLYVIGICAPLKILPGTISVLVSGILFIVILIICFLIIFLTGNRVMLSYVSMVSLFYVAMVAVYTITVVHQRRFDYVARGDHVLQATILASLFVYMINTVATIVVFGEFLIEEI